MQDSQHCGECRTEYLPGVATCADCGGSLRPGPLPAETETEVAPSQEGARVSVDPSAPPDTFLVTLPGLQAEFAAKSMTLEGISCLLVHGSIRRLRLPGDPPVEPFAVTLPVDVYVPGEKTEEARGILESIERDDLIEDQWLGDASPAPPSPSPRNTETAVEAPAQMPDYGGPRAEGAALQWALIAVGAVILALLVFL